MSYSDLQPEDFGVWLSELEKIGVLPAILDMRDAVSRKAGMMPGAVPADEQQIRQLLRVRHRPVLVYCYHGHSSRELAGFLSQMGMRTVFNLEGGWQAFTSWRDHQGEAISPALSHWLNRHGFRNQSLYARIDSGITPLMLAALDGCAEFVAEMLELGAEVDAINIDGNQVLWMACVVERIDIIDMLIAAGSDIGHLNKAGYSALMYAASSGKLQVVNRLLEAGADTTLQNPDGLNALECAATLPVLRRLRAVMATH